jgi:hypothetical protein
MHDRHAARSLSNVLLLPREHGAYAELGFSIATALGLSRGVTAGQLLLAASAIVFFLAHEPILILRGARGNRRSAMSRHAAAVASFWIGVGAVAGIAGWLAAPAARAAVSLPLFFGGLLAAAIWKQREKSAAGEILVALTFSSAIVPLAIAGGAAAGHAAIGGAVWAIIFIVQTFTVREVRARGVQENKRKSLSLIVSIGAAAGAWLLVQFASMPDLAAAALLPALVISAACGLRRVTARRLRTVGWAFAASDLFALWAILAAFD